MMRLQHILLAFLLLLLAAPIPTILILHGRSSGGPLEAWLANRTLTGVPLPRQDVIFSKETWLDGSYQRSVTQWINENFAGRELAIRCFNQVLWSLFEKSYMHHESIIGGQQSQLFGGVYLDHFSHMGPLQSDEALDRVAADIGNLNARLRLYHVPLVVLFTPSKPLTMPEFVPERYLAKRILTPTVYERDRLKIRLAAAGIPVLDGAELTRSLRGRLPMPPFPKTGLHWTDLAAFYTAEALLRKLEPMIGRPLAHLELSNLQFSNTPKPPDDDVLQLLNLAEPHFDRYAYAKVSRSPVVSGRQGRLVLVGGSFLHALNRIWEEGEVWQEIDHYFFSLALIHYPEGNSASFDLATIDWPQTIGRADAVVVEINEAIVGSDYSTKFIAAALHGLPEPAPPISSLRSTH